MGYNPRPMADPQTNPQPVVTRFAPSPTGELHIGGARTALYSWAYAKRHAAEGGKFMLRFEDTDQKRSSKQAEANILRDLEWLGLTADNQDSIPRQSERLPLYEEALAKLDAAGLTYEDGGAVRFRMNQPVGFTDAVYGDIRVEADDLEDFVIRKGDSGGGFPTFHLAVVVDDIDMGVTHVIRGQEHLTNTAKHAALYDALGAERPIWCHTPSIMNPDGSKMSKRDKAKQARKFLLDSGISASEVAEEAAKRILRHILQNPPEKHLDELIHKPGKLTLHGFDHASVSYIMWGGDVERPEGESFLEEVQAAYEAFLNKENDSAFLSGIASIFYPINLPEINVADFREAGYLPDVLLNYIALLGWNPGNDLERFDLNYLSQHFGFDRIGKSNSKFDREKLDAFNQDTILQMPPEDWAAALGQHFETHHAEFHEQLGDNLPIFASMYQERSKTLSDPAQLGSFFFTAPTEYNAKAVKKNLSKNEGEGLKHLAATREALAGVEDWSAMKLHQTLDDLWPTLGCKHMGGVAQPLRVALTGNAISPEIGPTLELLGKQETLQRIDDCLTHHAAN
jgi:glutamyl-tRNA synthetase